MIIWTYLEHWGQSKIVQCWDNYVHQEWHVQKKAGCVPRSMDSVSVEMSREPDEAQPRNGRSHRREGERQHLKRSTSQKKLPCSYRSFSMPKECKVKTQAEISHKENSEDNAVDDVDHCGNRVNAQPLSSQVITCVLLHCEIYCYNILRLISCFYARTICGLISCPWAADCDALFYNMKAE